MRTLWFPILLCLLAANTYCAALDETSDEANTIDVDEVADTVSEKPSKGEFKTYFGDSDVNARGELIHSLLHNYDKRNYPSNVTLKFGVSILNANIDEMKSTLEVDVWLKYMWNDPRLHWDDSKHNIGVVRINPDQLWFPDITLYNSADHEAMMRCKPTNTLVYPNGKVLWVPPCHLSAYCNLTLSTEPYAPQHCTLKFGSWTFDGYSLDLQFYKNEEFLDTHEYRKVSPWELLSNTAKRNDRYYDCCQEPYSDLTYNLTLQRKTGAHIPCRH